MTWEKKKLVRRSRFLYFTIVSYLHYCFSYLRPHLISDSVAYRFWVIFFNKQALREQCPNTEFFLVPIFLYSDWIQRFTKEISVFSPNTGHFSWSEVPLGKAFPSCKITFKDLRLEIPKKWLHVKWFHLLINSSIRI